MSPNRKRPQCHTCNHPMAGHKRPNGAPVCPTSASPQPQDSLPSPPTSPSPGSSRQTKRTITALPTSGRWVNPNFVEPSRAPALTSERRDTPMTWVSTEPADDQPPVKNETQTAAPRPSPDVIECMVNESVSTSSPSSSSSTSTRLQRTLTWLGSGVPLATVFSTPREEITALTRGARERGLHAGIAHFPRDVVKREPSSVNSPLERQSSWRVFIGRDAGAVTHLVNLHEKDAIGALDYGQRNERVGAYPPDTQPSQAGIFILYGLFCSGLTTLMMFWLLSST